MSDSTPANRLLEGIMRRESRSLLQYVHDSFPWTAIGDETALAQIRQMAAEEQACAASLGRFLASKRHTVPYLGSYPTSFTTINYASLNFLLPRLVAEERRSITQLENDINTLPQDEARILASTILEKKQGHLKSLESLASTHRDSPVSKA